MATRTVTLTLINDLICPNCCIQQHELLDAMSYCKDTLNLPIQFEVQHMPFKLISNACLSDDSPKIEKTEFLIKWVGKEKFENFQNVITKWAEEKGIPLSFRGVVSQSTRGHRLSRKAYEIGGERLQTPVLTALFKAYLEEGKDIADFDVLSDIAESTGMMTKEEALAFLKSDELVKEINEMCDNVRAKGVTGVPMTVIDGKWAMSGGQSAEVFIQIFKKLANTSVSAAPSPMPSQAMETELLA